jgi:hypothetical protein
MNGKSNRKKIAAGIATLSLAGIIVLANSVLTLNAFAYDALPDIQAEETSVSGADMPAASPNIEISGMTDSDDMAAKRTPEDMTKEQAVSIAAEATEDKFGISLDGTYATPIFCRLEAVPGNYYFVSFVDKEAMRAAENASKATGEKESGPAYDVYIAFINAKTGEVVSVERNPIADGDTSQG